MSKEATSGQPLHQHDVTAVTSQRQRRFLQALIDRLVVDHGSMHQDLVGLFGCSRCKSAGRDRRAVFFTCIPDYEGQQRERKNRDWKPTFDRR